MIIGSHLLVLIPLDLPIFFSVPELAIIFANRSAALYHMGRNELALRDITRALSYGYPEEMEYKLRERQARCHMANKDPYEAQEAFKLTMKALDKSKMPMDRRLKMEKECETMVQLFIRNKEKPKPSPPAGTKKPKSQLHAALAFDFDEKNGRYAKAKDRINVGETVVVEKPHCSMLLEKFKTTHCHHCFKRTLAPLCCDNCTDALFCGEPCKDSAMKSYHKNECQILSNLNATGLSIICFLALRIWSQKSVQYFENFFKEIGDKMEIDFEERMDAQVNDYRKIYNLFKHDDRSPDELLQHAIVADYLVNLLNNVGYFAGSIDPEIKLKLGALTLRNIQILQFNTHEIFELETKQKGAQKESTFIAGALYPTVALFNHSCNPGVIRYFRGNTIYLHTIKTIEPGELIAENYGPIYTTQNRSERRNKLQDIYRFNCECEACTDDWPRFDQMSTNHIQLRCKAEKHPCGGTVFVPIDCADFLVNCNDCGMQTNIFNGLKAMEDIDNMMSAAGRLLDNGEVDGALRKYIAILQKMHETCVPPFKDYILCQQKIRDCLLEYGNKYMV